MRKMIALAFWALALLGFSALPAHANAEPYLVGPDSCTGSGAITGLVGSINGGSTLVVEGNPYVSGGYKGTARILHQAHLTSVTSPAGTFTNSPVVRNVSGWLNGQVTQDVWTMVDYVPNSTVEITVQYECTATSSRDLIEEPGVGSYQAFVPN